MAYFDYHPNIVLPSFSPDRNSSNDATVVKNLFKRGKIREKYFENAMSFELGMTFIIFYRLRL